MQNPVNAGTAPLTFAQKARLLVECLPVVFFSLALLFALTLLDDITGAPASPLLILFLCCVTFFMAWVALNRIRDLASGVVLLREDLLERSWRSRGSSGPNAIHGKFQQLGRMRLSRKAYGQGQHGVRYRVSYSPASKIVWSLDQLP
jgi:hypothetical protein